MIRTDFGVKRKNTIDSKIGSNAIMAPDTTIQKPFKSSQWWNRDVKGAKSRTQEARNGGTEREMIP